MPFVALLASAIVGFLAQAAASLVGRVLIALGIGFVTYNGLDFLMSGLRSLFLSYLGNTGSVFDWIPGVIGMLQIPRCMNFILTTLAVRATLAGVTGGSVRKMVQK